MADLDELLSEGLISPRALERLNTIYAPSSNSGALAPPSQPNSMPVQYDPFNYPAASGLPAQRLAAPSVEPSWLGDVVNAMPDWYFPESAKRNLLTRAHYYQTTGQWPDWREGIDYARQVASAQHIPETFDASGFLRRNYESLIAGPLREAAQIEAGHPEGTQTQATVDAFHRFFNGGSGDPEQDKADRDITAGLGASMAGWVAMPGLGRAATLAPGEANLGVAGGRIGAPIRRFGIPPAADPPIFSYRNTNTMRSHPDYAAAKAGDPASADSLVNALVKPQNIEEARQRFGTDVTYVPVHAEEAAGRNKIPGALAFHFADQTGAQVSDDIMQASRAYHTGANAMERMIARPTFDGPVEAGRRYVLVDDVGVMGNTLAELANHIRSNGGQVAGVTTLVHRSPLEYYAPTSDDISRLVAKHGQAPLEHFGIDPGALTAQEAEYLGRFRAPDTLRDRVAQARSQRQLRLLSTGRSAPEGGEGE
jgi:hypothetical protein